MSNIITSNNPYFQNLTLNTFNNKSMSQYTTPKCGSRFLNNTTSASIFIRISWLDKPEKVNPCNDNNNNNDDDDDDDNRQL